MKALNLFESINKNKNELPGTKRITISSITAVYNPVLGKEKNRTKKTKKNNRKNEKHKRKKKTRQKKRS